MAGDTKKIKIEAFEWRKGNKTRGPWLNNSIDSYIGLTL